MDTMSNYMLHARRPLVEGVDYIEPKEGEDGPRKRSRRPAFPSTRTKRKRDNDGMNHGPRGGVRYNTGVLEYFNTDEHVWIPAVFHCRIRDRLLAKSKTCAADVYTHPRDRGRGALDKTAFLQSQKDWNLERDDGWNGVEVLFAFDKVQFNNNTPNPTYEVPWLYEDGCVVLDLDNWPLNAFESIPLTLSSNVEGGLMEAIIRYDDRIQMEDLWARLPGICGHGGIYVPHTLTQRRSRFRERNWITCWGAPRKGSENLQKHIRNQMSPAMIAANSTRGLHKPSRAEQREMKKVNAGKHNQNAGGYALERDGSEEGAPARKRSRAHQVRKGASTRRSPRQPTPSVVSAPEASTEADWNPLLDQNPLLDPRLLMDHDGFELDNQYAAPAVGNGMPDQNIFCSTNPPVEAPYTFYGSSPSLGSNTYQCAPNFGSNTYQFAPSFVRSTSMWDTASMLGEQQLNPFQDLVHDW